MFPYILRRILQMIPTLAGVILLIFFLFKWFGGDPAEIMVSLRATKAQIASVRAQLGLDLPVWEQLWIFVQQIFSFFIRTDRQLEWDGAAQGQVEKFFKFAIL